jgi:hypothetical protein
MSYCEREDREKYLMLIRLIHVLFAKYNDRYSRFHHWVRIRESVTARNIKAAGGQQNAE